MEDKTETIYIGCQCHSPYHIVRVSLWDWKGKEPPELYFELQADRYLGLWGRLKAATRFVFGGENLGWHDVIPNHDDVINLHRVIDNYNKAYNVYEAKEEVKK